MATRNLHVVEFSGNGKRYVAYGGNPHYLPVHTRSVDDDWHRVTSMHWLSCTKFMEITAYRKRKRMTCEEIQERYGVRLGRKDPVPIG